MNGEIENKKWFWAGIALQFGTGYAIAYFVYQIGTLATTGALAPGFFGGLIFVAILIAIVVCAIARNKKAVVA